MSNNYFRYAYPRDIDFSQGITIRGDLEPEDRGVEEWVWVTGYKGTDMNMKCRGYQFELGKQFDMPEDEEIELCRSGFHFCQELRDVFHYYGIGHHRYFEVKALVRRYNKNGTYTYDHIDDKMTSKSIEFIRELTVDEIFGAYNLCDTSSWTREQKELALNKGVPHVLNLINTNKLIELGYSEAFANWVIMKGVYDTARTMAMTPGVSMDVKVLTIAMAAFED